MINNLLYGIAPASFDLLPVFCNKKYFYYIHDGS